MKQGERGVNSLQTAVVDWVVTHGLVDYEAAVAQMEAHVAKIIEGQARERIWLVEHPALYTAGTSAVMSDLLESDRFPVHRTGRGGQFTYHGPGQRVAYVMLDLKRRGQDVRRFVTFLEQWLITTLQAFGVQGQRRDGRVGVWVARPELGACHEDKIAALGIRVRKWVTFHGVSLNVSPDLSHFSGIIPCGVRAHGVTSLADLGVSATLSEVDRALRKGFESVFAVSDKAIDLEKAFFIE